VCHTVDCRVQLLAESRFVECNYAEWHFVDTVLCSIAELSDILLLNVTMLNVILLSVTMQSVMCWC
jgi:hypothetical protein